MKKHQCKDFCKQDIRITYHLVYASE